MASATPDLHTRKSSLLPYLGYISKGDNVPEVITTDWNLSKIGRMAIDASRHLKCMTGFITFGVLSSDGSMIIVKPWKVV